MPELPDVEVCRRRLAVHEGHRVEDVTVHDSRVHKASPGALRSRLRGARLGRPARHGKWLVAPLDEGALAMHFGMTGDLVELGDGDEPGESRLLLRLDDGDRLAYVCRRELGHIELVDGLDDLRRAHDLGPDVLELDEARFLALLREHRGMLKGVLLDQSVVAGLGNVYADEALFQARIHPRTRIEDLDDEDLRRLFRAVREVTDWAMDAAGSVDRPRGGVRRRDAPDDWLMTHRRAGADCPRCGGSIVEVKAGGRNGFACPSCQPEP